MIFNTSLKSTASDSHTQLLQSVPGEIMERNGIAVEHVHMAALQVAFGV